VERQASSQRIFLSFAYVDHELAERLAGALRDRGASVWTGLEQLQLGDPLANKIEGAIRGSDVFLVLVTPASVASAWVMRELSAAVKAQQGRGRTKVVPIRVDDAPMPAAMQDIVWLDATSAQIELAADRLLGPMRTSARRSRTSVREEVAQRLVKAGVEWVANAALGGVRADFLVTTPDDRWVVLDVKSSEPTLVDAVKARTEASRLREAAGADAAFIVFPRVAEGFPEQGIVGLDDLSRGDYGERPGRACGIPRRPKHGRLGAERRFDDDSRCDAVRTRI
jgi:hypothetical protein